MVILMEGFFCVVAVLAPQRRFRPGWPPSVSLFPAGTPLVAETTEIFLLNDLGCELWDLQFSQSHLTVYCI